MQSLNSIENFKQIEGQVAQQLYQRNGGQILQSLPIKDVRKVIYENLQQYKEYYDQNNIQYNVQDINNNVIQNSIQFIESQVQPQQEQLQQVNTNTMTESQQVAERFKQLQQQRNQDYEQFIPQTEQQQGNPSFDTRNFADVRQNPPSYEQRQLLQPVMEEVEEQLRMKQMTEQAFQERIQQQEEQDAEFYNINNGGFGSGGDGIDQAIGSGAGLEALLKPPIQPQFIRSKKYIAIFSGNRNVQAYPSRSSYIIQLQKDIQKVKKVKIVKIVVPSEIEQRRYVSENLENLRDYFQTNNYNYEHAIMIDFKNISGENQNDSIQPAHTVAAIFNAYQDQYRGRKFAVYENVSEEAIEFNGSAIDSMKTIEIDVRDQMGNFYKNNPQDNFRITDLLGQTTANVISTGTVNLSTTFSVIKIGLNQPFEVNQFFMGDYILGADSLTYYYDQNQGLYKFSTDVNGVQYKNFDGASTQIDLTGSYTTGEIKTLIDYLGKISGHQIVEVQNFMTNVGNTIAIQLPATLLPPTTYDGTVNYQFDPNLISIINKFKKDGSANATITGNLINLSLQHTIICELECEIAEMDSSNLKI